MTQGGGDDGGQEAEATAAVGGAKGRMVAIG